MKTKIITIVAVIMLVGLPMANGEIVLTFDDIGEVDESTLIPDGYGGFDWDYFYYRNSSVPSQTNGYNNGLVSGVYLAHNSGYFNLVGLSGTSFTFQGAWLTAAWRDGLNIKVEGYYFDETKWDGSDLCAIDEFPMANLVTERVAKAMKKAKVTNCKYIPLEKMGIFK